MARNSRRQSTSRLKMKADEDGKESQRVVNAYHRVFVGQDWEVARKDMEERFTMKQPAAVFARDGKCDPYRALFIEGSRAVMCHIDSMLEKKVVGDANVEQPAVKVIK